VKRHVGYGVGYVTVAVEGVGDVDVQVEGTVTPGSEGTRWEPPSGPEVEITSVAVAEEADKALNLTDAALWTLIEDQGLRARAEEAVATNAE
jgi:hypothetical protein